MKAYAQNFPSCATLEMYNKIPIFIPVDITEDSVKLIAQKVSGVSGPVGMDSEATLNFVTEGTW